MKKSLRHIPAGFMAGIYSSMVLRFLVYGAYGYAVSVGFTYVYYAVVSPGSGLVWKMNDNCPLTPYSAVAYALIVGFFAIRDGLESYLGGLADVLARLPLRQKI